MAQCGQIDRWADSQTEGVRQLDRQTDRWADRYIDGQTERLCQNEW